MRFALLGLLVVAASFLTLLGSAEPVAAACDDVHNANVCTGLPCTGVSGTSVNVGYLEAMVCVGPGTPVDVCASTAAVGQSTLACVAPLRACVNGICPI